MIFILIVARLTAGAQTNVELIDQLVTESQSEHSRQVKVRDRQASVSANEEINRSQMTTMKTTGRDIHSRFHTLGLVINAAEIGLEASPLLEDILKQQQLIVSLCQKYPMLLALALNSEADLADQANLLIDYSYGLLLSIGDIDQMKASDRKMLFSYVITELRRIDGASRGLAVSLANFLASLGHRSLNPFSGFVSKDKALVDDIVRNAAALKN